MSDFKRNVIGWPYPGAATSAAFSGLALDASGDKVGYVFRAPYAEAITALSFRYATRTGTPPVYKIGLQGVSTTTGAPDGTYVGGGSPASATFTPPASTAWNGTVQKITLDNAYTPARGDVLALVIEYSSGTVDGSNNGTFSYQSAASGSPGFGLMQFPYPLTNTGAWSKSAYLGCFGVHTASHCWGHAIITVLTTGSATNGHRIGRKFTLPGTGTYQVIGVRFLGQIPKTSTIQIWDTDGTTKLQEITSDVDQTSGGDGLAVGQWEMYFDESTLATLDFGSSYRFSIEVTNSTTHHLHRYQFNSGDADMFPGGADWCYTSYNGSSWSDDVTMCPQVALLIEDVTVSSGGSAGIFFAVRP